MYRYLHIVSILLSAALFSCSCSQKPAPPLTYLALGDSYTVGEAVPDSLRFPVQLADAIEDSGLAMNDPVIIARTGWTTGDLRQAIADTSAALHPPYDLVTLLIGVNDQYRGMDIANYPGNFKALLGKAIDFAGGNKSHVLVISIPDYGATPFARNRNPDKIGRELDQYNRVNKRIADSLGVRYVNVTPISRRAAGQPSLVASDSLHPSGEMYRLWAREILEELFPGIKNR